ncbi:unnamed protein product [Polarella glacialis]|uniref:Uncharacterized protein n=1 Tax=Polarella glacialis TaxID=89957 RepID=A0A813KA77_POLGL|nr:unnamed protein product [Polarella glacialis]
MSYYVGAERRNPVQKEACWRNRIEHEEGAAVRAAASHLGIDYTRPSPVNWQSPPTSRCGTAQSELSRGLLASRGHNILTAQHGTAPQQKGFERLGTASSRASADTSISVGTMRSTVLSMELEHERERREVAEKEVSELRAQLGFRNAKAALGSAALDVAAPAAGFVATPRAAATPRGRPTSRSSVRTGYSSISSSSGIRSLRPGSGFNQNLVVRGS